MRHSRRSFIYLLLALGLGPLLVQAANLVPNGGFEKGEAGWMWEQWAKKPLPGFIDKDDMAEGLASFKMTHDGGEAKRWMGIEFDIEPQAETQAGPYVFSFALKPENIPADAVRVRFQRAGKGWWHGPAGKPDLVTLGGTSDEWLRYQYRIPANDMKGASKIRIFFYHDKVNHGVLGIDDVQLRIACGDAQTQVPEAPEAPQGQASTQQKQDGLVTNGGFESGISGWMYQQWNGKQAPGDVVTDGAPQGNAWFRYTRAGGQVGDYIAKELELPDTSADYRVSFRLKTGSVPRDAARVRLQIPGKGWLHTDGGYPDQVKTGGDQGWQRHIIQVPASARAGKGKATLFFYHDQPGQGSIGIDDIQLLTPGQSAKADGDDQATYAPLEGTLQAVSYHPEIPSVLVPQEAAKVAVRVSPEQAIYRPDQLPEVRLESVPAEGAKLNWEVRDGFQQVIQQGTRSVAEGASEVIDLEAGHGYYEVIATLERGGETLGEARRSIGALSEPPPTDTDEPFGLWIQGRHLYPELGVRWVREGLYYGSMAADPDGFLAYWRKQFQWYRDHDIKVLAYPKAQPTEFRLSRELMKDTPEAWAALEAHWTRLVIGLSGQVDAWGVLNEPMADFWQGTDEMVVRYWALMHRIVQQHDPGTPVVGPSINPLKPRHIQQWGDLLDLGIAPYLDAIEVHTYTPSPEDNKLLEATERFQDMAREVSERELDVWVTEMGISATYPQELMQAQFLMRSWLLAKEADYPMMIWHMFSWPQGEDQREVNFGNWRHYKELKRPPQPRPAGLTYGVMTRQLAGATFRTKLDYLGPAVNAYVLERRGEAVLALWTTSAKSYKVQVPVDRQEVTQTGIFGREQPLRAQDGLVSLTVDRSPVFLSPMPAHMLDAQPMAHLPEMIETFPGGQASADLVVRNPHARPTTLTIEWLARDGWDLSSERQQWDLQPHESITTRIRVQAPTDTRLGAHQLYGKASLAGTYVAPVAVPVTVHPPVRIVDVRPALADGPTLKVSLQPVDQDADTLQVGLADQGQTRQVKLDQHRSGELLTVELPVAAPPAGHLQTYEVFAAANGIRTSESKALSFVPAYHFTTAPTIDGAVDDWPGLTAFEPQGTSESMAIRWGWDADHLFLAVRVNDAYHHQEQQPYATWQNDSLQIGVVTASEDDLVRPPNTGLQEADYVELDASLKGNQPLVYRHRTVNKHLAQPGAVPADAVARTIQRSGDTTTYEFAIPVAQLGAKPFEAGQVLRVALLVNDADEEGGGIGRQTREWFVGIKTSKDPSTFGHLILER